VKIYFLQIAGLGLGKQLNINTGKGDQEKMEFKHEYSNFDHTVKNMNHGNLTNSARMGHRI